MTYVHGFITVTLANKKEKEMDVIYVQGQVNFWFFFDFVLEIFRTNPSLSSKVFRTN